MAHDTDLAGITLPDPTDAADGPTQLAAMVADIEPKLIVPMTHATRAALGAANDGLVVYETDTDGYFLHHGSNPASGWNQMVEYDPTDANWDLPGKPWGLPWGYVDRKVDSSLRAGFTETTTKIDASLDSTKTYVAGRRIKITGHVNFGPAIGNPSIVIHVYKDGSPLDKIGQAQSTPTSSVFLATGSAYDQPSAGSHTYGLYIQVAGGGTTADVFSNANPSWILIEDIGPA